MPRLAILVAASLVVGVAVGAWLSIDESVDISISNDASKSTAESGSLSGRVLSLERELKEERNAREVLEEQLLAILEQLDGYGPGARPQSRDPFTNSLSAQTSLRAEIGDTEYERFLVAQGQRTNVQIASVLDGAPGSKAGLRPGDEIISYNGERTFSMMDLRELAMGGDAGESAIIEIDRDGVRMQLSIPRGPIGMNGNGAVVRTMTWWGG